MPGDEPQETAEELDDEQLEVEPDYGRGDEAIDPPEVPMGVDEPGPDTPDPYSLADRELQRGWRSDDDPEAGHRWIDTSAASEDTERQAVADEWRDVSEPSAEEQAINEVPAPRYREGDEEQDSELEAPDRSATEPRDPEESDPGIG